MAAVPDRVPARASRTLGARLLARDAAAFTGRRDELAWLERRSEAVVVGAAGSGKSALLRELARRRGPGALLIDARELCEPQRGVELELARLGLHRASLVIVDHYDELPADDARVLRVALRGRPYVLAGRRAPAGTASRLRLDLAPLPEPDARALLAAHGVSDRGWVDELVRRAEGSPLALVLAARGACVRCRRMLLGEDPQIAPSLLRRANADDVRAALRNLRDPGELSRSPLARGVGEEARAESVRLLIARAIERGFGEDPYEQDLRRTVELAYLRPRRGHEQTADALNLSRSAYFARLRQALERIVPFALAEPR
jgi:hypothetical protein